MDQLADQTIVSRPRSQALQYDGRIGELYGIFLMNILFTIITLGIFRFWAITRYRRYFWSRMRFQGERFEYTGTGSELLVGYLLAGLALIGLIGVGFALSFGLAYIWAPLAFVPIFAVYVFIIILASGAVFSAQRYRLSRTLWCGIRGGMTGSMLSYGWRAVLYSLATALTLLQLLPWMQVRLAERRINASHFGSAKFAFSGRASQLYLPFLATLVGSFVLILVVTGVLGMVVYAAVPNVLQQLRQAGAGGDMSGGVGIFIVVAYADVFISILIWALLGCWYRALFERHVVGNTTLGDMRLQSTMTGGGLLGLIIGNILIATFTLGLGYPIVMHRNARFLASTLWADGGLHPASLAQSTAGTPRFGEGMFQQLDGGGVL
jgi:uncharacterized membrane protein YjgN (DUF898 family)